MFAVHHEALVEVVLLTCCIHGAKGGEYSLRHDLSKGHRRVMLRNCVLMVRACQDFVCAKEDSLGEFTSFSIEGHIVVVPAGCRLRLATSWGLCPCRWWRSLSPLG